MGKPAVKRSASETLAGTKEARVLRVYSAPLEPEFADRIDRFHRELEAELGSTVTRAVAVRRLLSLGLARIAELREELAAVAASPPPGQIAGQRRS